MKKPKKVAYSFLIGDLFHFGHLKMLETARANSDYHICGVISDDVVDKWISPKICSYNERQEVIRGVKYVDEVVCQESMDPTDNLKAIRDRFPDAVLVLVQNHHLWESTLGSSFVQQANGKIIEHDFYPNLSRENISTAFLKAYLEKRSMGGMKFNELALGNITYYKDRFSTKANTLRELKGYLKSAVIEQEFVFTTAQWQNEDSDIVCRILELFGETKLVVRSSSRNEDCLSYSNAGYYKSVLNVLPSEREIRRAVEAVLDSYKEGHGFNAEDQVLIQRQTEGIMASGVVFTRNLWTNTPYYVINYDDSGDVTDSVTSGIAGTKIEILRDIDIEEVPVRWRQLMLAISEIEEFFKGVALDIEFAIKNGGEVVIFQVRPLAANSRFSSLDDDLVKDKVRESVRAYTAMVKAGQPRVNEVLLSDMAFWNPAELVGDRPDYLDSSLFTHLVMKKSWNEALLPFGYSRVEDSLQQHIGGKPYINMQSAFLCLLPESLPRELKWKLVNFYNTRIKNNPALHDKIEFEVVHNCYRFDFHKAKQELLEGGFMEEEICVLEKELRVVTNGILSGFDATIDSDQRSIALLDKKFKELRKEAEKAVTVFEKLTVVSKLIEDCKVLGIGPFVRAARCAFIGNAMLSSLKQVGAVAAQDVSRFVASIKTVASEMDSDINKFRQGYMDVKEFIEKYGHLRPGTYDITKLPYSKNPSYVCDGVVQDYNKEAQHENLCGMTDTMAGAITDICGTHGIMANGESLLAFIQKAIQLREHIKFIYTKNISLALEIIADMGDMAGLARSDMAHLDYYSIINHNGSCEETEILNIWHNLVKSRREEKRINALLSLPPIVFSNKDFVAVPSYSVAPNFIGGAIVEGELVFIDKAASGTDIADKIVVIEKADPGYDWIFTKRIKGLLTKYGGVASHMAIRCSEFDIPAAIGCGDMLFSRILKSSRVMLDCNKKMIAPI